MTADDPPVARNLRLTIINRRGLHARAAAKLATVASRYQAKIEVIRGDIVVNAASIMGLMMLAAGMGSEIDIRAEGEDADAALAALKTLVESGFDEGA